MATVLFVDDDPGILKALRRLFYDSAHTVLFAADPREGLAILKERECAVVVSDNRMPPGESGIDFLDKVRRLAPDSVRIMMTGFADLATALDAINRCEAYRFVVKPWDNRQLVELVDEAALRYELLVSLRSGDERIFRTLAQAIELKDRYTRGHCDRVVESSVALGHRLGLQGQELTDLAHGAILHDCGKIGVPGAILNHPGGLEREQMDIVRQHPAWGAEVARQAGVSSMTLNVILYHHEHFDGHGYPAGLAGTDIPLEARIVAAADVYDALTVDRPYRRALLSEDALREFMAMSGSVLDPDVVAVFMAILNDAHSPGDAK
ncbi:HD-GYP domain-containing protein [Oryzomonas japonica]|nr:HD domain-containing phosphohydrolase [Oryzomonas japonica]